MKKLLAMLMILSMLLFSVVGCTDNDNDSDSNDPQNVEQNGDSEGGDDAEKLLSTAYADYMRDGKYYMHFRSTDMINGEQISGEYLMACNDKKIYTHVKYEDSELITISDDSTVYYLDPASKTYFKLNIEASEDTASASNALPDLAYTGSGTAELEGKTLKYEEYATADAVIRYYFDKDTLYAISSKDAAASADEGAEGEAIMYIVEMSDNVPDSLFEIPQGYTEQALDFGDGAEG